MMSISCNSPDIQSTDHPVVPNWHRIWVTEHARNLAQKSFLATVELTADGPQIETRGWEAAGRVVIHDVLSALALIEDPDTAERAALYGAECFLRAFFGLVFASICGGRA